jgi:hypothetical protein
VKKEKDKANWQFLYWEHFDEQVGNGEDPIAEEKIFFGTFIECCKKFYDFILLNSNIDAVDPETKNIDMGDSDNHGEQFKDIPEELFHNYL